MFGDGREERLDALSLELQLKRSKHVRLRQQRYSERVARAREEAVALGDDEVIRRLIAHNPAYVRSLLETENERHGAGSLQERYARTFCNLSNK